jgi:phenylacetate-CoA ligase
MMFSGLRIALVGPLPPPFGGMANQTQQLTTLLEAGGARVQLVAVNPPYKPKMVGNIKVLRAIFRLTGYVRRLWVSADQVDLFHVMANSGWSWHLHAAPAIWIARIKRKPVIVNYRGGDADNFFARQMRIVSFSLSMADAIIVPSNYLAGIFKKYGFSTQIVPNIIDLSRFVPGSAVKSTQGSPIFLVARNLEMIYDNANALRAFAIIRQTYSDARLLIAGSGSERGTLEQLTQQLGLSASVQFTGRIDNVAMAALIPTCDIILNPSLVDNMPISILEALACAVPVVSTNVGGIPDLLQHGVTALLVGPADPKAMAQAALSLLTAPARARRIATAGHAFVQQFSWNYIAPQLLAQYRQILTKPHCSAYTSLVSSMLFPLHEKFKRHDSVRTRQEMEQSQWWAIKRLEQWQLGRLRSLLVDVGQHVPYYRDLYSRIGFDPQQVSTLADLTRLPIMEKAEISAHRDAFKSDVARDLIRFNTGGSSGEPLVFFIGKERIGHDVAAKWRATRWWGVDIGDPEVVVWGSPIELKAQDLLRRLRDKMLRSTLLPAFDMSSARLNGFIGHIRRTRPKILFGYPSALSHIARHARASNTRMDDLGIKVAFVTSERLYDEQRELIKHVFGCSVANGYGGRDAGFIAHECPQGGMHITAEDIIVEILDTHGRSVPIGTTGAIVVTHLATSDFPFIRYATGDVGALSNATCPCGRSLPLLQKIEGRSTDFLVAHDGTVMHGLALVYILRDLPQVKEFKIIQESLTLTRVQLVALPMLDKVVRHSIESQFKARLGPAVVIVIDEVVDIAPEKSGKFRYVISKVMAN